MRFSFAWLRVALLIAVALAPSTLRAQAGGAMTLDQMLAKMDANFEAYRRAVPSLSTDEHVKVAMSARDDQGSRNGDATVEATVHLKSTQIGSSALLVESRDVKTVDKKPVVTDADISGPDTMTGIFSYAAGFFSLDLKKCFDYKLNANGKWNKQPAMVVEYTLKAGLGFDVDCPVKEPSSGRAYLDPASLQILRVEQKVTRHQIAPGSYGAILDASSGPSVKGDMAATPMSGSMAGKASAMADSGSVSVGSGTYGSWSWSVDYAPVTLGGQTLWLPKSSASVTQTSSGKLISWTRSATYGNYQTTP